MSTETTQQHLLTRPSWLRAFAFSTVACLSVACSGTPRDTEGNTFTYDCEKGACILTSLETERAPSRRFEVRSGGKLLLACPEGQANPNDCRPITCETARTCTALGGAEFGCENQLCQADSRGLTLEDLLGLCLAGSGPYERRPEQLEKVLYAKTAAAQKEVPDGCRKP